MALHIRDPEAEEAVRELARMRNSTLTEAIRDSAKEAIARERRRLPLEERLGNVWAMVRAMPDSGEVADKAFFDQLWGEDPLGGVDD
jgi:antitoxin VapB